MRSLVYFVACTLDGYIAAVDGTFDFFPSKVRRSWTSSQSSPR